MAFQRKEKKTAESNETKQNPLQPILSAAGEGLNRALDYILHVSEISGKIAITTATKFAKVCVRIAKGIWKLIRKPVRKSALRFYRVYKRTFDIIAAPYFTFKQYFAVIRRRRDEAKAENRSTVDAFFATVHEGAKRNAPLIRKTVFNYTMPLVAIAVLATVVHVTTTLTFALDVNYNGKSIGTVSGESTYTDAETMFLQRIVYTDGDAPIEANSTLTLKLASKDDIIDTDALVNRMIRNSGEDVQEAIGVYVNNKLLASVENADQIKSTLNGLLASYKRSNTTSLTFEDKVELRSGLYLIQTMKPEQEIVNLLKSNKVEEKTYRIKHGDTMESVAKKFGIKLSKFRKLNPDATKKFLKGGSVKIRGSVPYLAVRETRRVRYTDLVDYDVKYVNDSSRLKGSTTVIQDGEEGKTRFTADISYVNGVEVDRKIIRKVVLKKPVDKKVARGTKTIAASYSAGADAHVSGNSDFIWPVGGGYTSSRYGWRSTDNHKGTDIAAPAGTPVYASAPGRVSLAGWYSGYGYCVIIDHGNGIQTLYGHNSSVYVSVGQQVRQGQNIAGVGQTGWATGNHCHFEIRVNGSCINPENYIGTR